MAYRSRREGVKICFAASTVRQNVQWLLVWVAHTVSSLSLSDKLTFAWNIRSNSSYSDKVWPQFHWHQTKCPCLTNILRLVFQAHLKNSWGWLSFMWHLTSNYLHVSSYHNIDICILNLKFKEKMPQQNKTHVQCRVEKKRWQNLLACDPEEV